MSATKIEDKSSLDRPLPTDKRFDSLGYLIQETAQDCGAACFYKGQILLSTNGKQHAHEKLLNLVLKYITSLAQESYKLNQDCIEFEKRRGLEFNGAYRKMMCQQVEKQHQLLYNQIIECAWSAGSIFTEDGVCYDPNTKSWYQPGFYESNEAFRDNFNRALEKIRRSIFYAYHNPGSESRQAWSKEVVTSFAFPQKKVILLNNIFKNNLHAELKIVAYLLQIGALTAGKKYYIGISKRCCPNCNALIQAVNQWKNVTIEVRDSGHDTHYKGAIPEFLHKSKELQTIFLEQMERTTGRIYKTYTDPFYNHDNYTIAKASIFSKKILSATKEHEASDEYSSESYKPQKPSSSTANLLDLITAPSPQATQPQQAPATTETPGASSQSRRRPASAEATATVPKRTQGFSFALPPTPAWQKPLVFASPTMPPSGTKSNGTR